MLDKTGLNDEKLTWKAKGILAYLISKPDNWKIIVKDLINRAKDGKAAVYSGIQELEDNGYIQRIQHKENNGRFGVMEYIVYEQPIKLEEQEKTKTPQKEPQESNTTDGLPDTENQDTVKSLDKSAVSPHTDFPDTDKPDTENQPLLINKSSNNYLLIDNESIYQSEIIKSEAILNYIQKHWTDRLAEVEVIYQTFKIEAKTDDALFDAMFYEALVMTKLGLSKPTGLRNYLKKTIRTLLKDAKAGEQQEYPKRKEVIPGWLQDQTKQPNRELTEEENEELDRLMKQLELGC